jgi:uncharacterized protein (DUF1330 family)
LVCHHPAQDNDKMKVNVMSKTYWVATYDNVSNPDKLAAYAEIAGPAIIDAGGTFIIRGMPSLTYEAGKMERTVVIEFDSVEAAVAAHDSPEYGRALAALGDGALRDIRIVEGV